MGRQEPDRRAAREVAIAVLRSVTEPSPQRLAVESQKPGGLFSGPRLGRTAPVGGVEP